MTNEKVTAGGLCGVESVSGSEASDTDTDKACQGLGEWR